MARQFYTPIDLNKNELRQAVLHLLGSDPGTPTEGQLWYNSTSHVPKIFNGTSNLDLTNPLLLNGQNGAYYLARANHSGTQLAATISDFNTAVRTNRLDQMAAPTATVSMGSQLISSVLDPVSAQDAATKAYVDAVAQGLSPKPAARAATTGALANTPTYANGTAGVGATLTANTNAAFPAQDGVTLALNDLLLVKNEATGANNGLYKLTQVGSGAVPWILTRDVDMDTAGEFKGAFIIVESGGTTLANTTWMATATGAITVGTTAVAFVQTNAAQNLSFSAPLNLSGTTVTAVLSARVVNTAGAFDLATGVCTPGTYISTTVDTYGRVTAGADLIGAGGFPARTAAFTYAARTMTGTASRLTITNGDGVSGNPTFDISTSYVGQATITTLGTITTGVWTGTAIAVLNGGTGATTATAARANLSVPGIYTALIGDGSTLTYSITQVTHLLRSDGAMQVSVYDASSGLKVEPDITINPANGTVTIGFAPTAPASNAYRVVIHG